MVSTEEGEFQLWSASGRALQAERTDYIKEL